MDYRTLKELPTPTLVVDEERLTANLRGMQEHCNTHGVRLWPHIKTHKTIEIAKQQLAVGAEGLVCAKLSEAEAMLPSGVNRIFLAYPLVNVHSMAQQARLRHLVNELEQLILAVTSLPQMESLASLLKYATVEAPVLMAVDTGLGREGVRNVEEAVELAEAIRRQPRMKLIGLFTHEGHSYRLDETGRGAEDIARGVVSTLSAIRERIDPNGELTLWPGSSVTAKVMAALPGVYAIRPGAYVFGDLWLSQVTKHMKTEEVAATVMTTVIDRPQRDLALVDGGSKTFSSDVTPDRVSAASDDGRDIRVTRLSEEQGFVTGTEVSQLSVEERVRFIPAHICPVVNLTDELVVVRGEQVIDHWDVVARGKVQ
jgi:D-serine deaminase-like pyridoxal phosphate-dependent protein